MEVPLEIPHPVGASTIDITQNVNYTGTWHSFPHKIRITGPITNPIVTNLTTDEVLDFTGITIAAGDYYDLDLRYGYKTVVDDDGVSVLDELTAASDLAAWHLKAETINSIQVEGTAVTVATKVEISYFTRYLGI